MRASTALPCLAFVGAMSAGCTLLNSGDDLLRDSGVRADVSMGPVDAFVPPDAMCPAGSESDDSQCKDDCDNDGNGLTDCADPSCASVAICRPTCTIPDDCGDGAWCVTGSCVPTITITVSLLDGRAVVPATISSSDSEGLTIQSVRTDGVSGSAVLEALPGGVLMVQSDGQTLQFTSLPVELDGQTMTLSAEPPGPATTPYNAQSSIAAATVLLSTGCESNVAIVPALGTPVTVHAGGHCASALGPVVLGCNMLVPTDCGLTALITGGDNSVGPGSTGTFGMDFVGIAPVVSTITFRIGNSSIRTWDTSELPMNPRWTLPDITGTGVVAHLEAVTSNGDHDLQRVVHATKSPQTFPVTELPGVLSITVGASTTWSTPLFHGDPPAYYALSTMAARNVVLIVPGDTTSVVGSYDQVAAFWDNRSVFLGNPYAGAMRFALNATLEDNTIVAASAAY